MIHGDTFHFLLPRMRISNRVDRSSDGEATELVGFMCIIVLLMIVDSLISHAHNEISRQNERFMRAALCTATGFRSRYITSRDILFALRCSLCV
jgi:hypothetical protein